MRKLFLTISQASRKQNLKYFRSKLWQQRGEALACIWLKHTVRKDHFQIQSNTLGRKQSRITIALENLEGNFNFLLHFQAKEKRFFLSSFLARFRAKNILSISVFEKYMQYSLHSLIIYNSYWFAAFFQIFQPQHFSLSTLSLNSTCTWLHVFLMVAAWWNIFLKPANST